MMKKIFLLIFTAFLFTGLSSFQYQPQVFSEKPLPNPEQSFQVPDNIKVILDNYCLQCHGTDGSGKAKMKWNFDKMSGMKHSKMLSKLSKISDDVSDESMPPKKYLKKHPEKSMSADEKQLLIDWADELAESLIGQ